MAEKLSDKRCETCECWVSHNKKLQDRDRGECHFFPPQVTGYTPTHGDDSCWQHVPKASK